MKRLALILTFLALCFSALAAPPPPILYTFYTTNKTIDVNRWVTNIATNMAVIWGGGGGAFIQNSNGFGTNVTLSGSVNFGSVVPSRYATWTSGNTITNSASISGGDYYRPTFRGYGDGLRILSIKQSSGPVADVITVESNGIFNSVTSAIFGGALTITNDVTGHGSIILDGQFSTLQVTGVTASIIGTSFSGGGGGLTNLTAANINGAFTGITNNGGTYLSGNVGIGTASPDALLHLSGSSGGRGIIYTNPGTGKSLVLESNANLTVSGSVAAGAGISAGQTIQSGGGYSVVSGDNFRFTLTGTRINQPTNGTVKFGDSSQTATAVGNGATLLFDTVSKFPFSAASKGVLTNGQWGLGNTNGVLTAMTSMDGTNRSDILKLATNSLTFSGVNNSPLVTMTNAAGAGLIRVASQMESAQPIACFGALMMNTTNLNAFGSAYTNVTGFDNVATNQFTAAAATGYLTNLIGGYYRATVNASFTGINNGAYEGCLLTNGVDAEIISWKKTFDAASRMDCMSAHGIIYLPANTACSFGIKESTSAGNVAIHRASLVIGTP